MKKSFLALCASFIIGAGAVTSSVYAQASSVGNPPPSMAGSENLAGAENISVPTKSPTASSAESTPTSTTAKDTSAAGAVSVNSAGNSKALSHDQPEPPEAPISTGQGTSVEIVEKTPGNREFITVKTQNGNDFFLIVDKEKATNNVYMLRAIEEKDLYEFVQEGTSVPEKDSAPFAGLEKNQDEKSEKASELSAEVMQDAPVAAEGEAGAQDPPKKKAGNQALLYLGVPIAVAAAYFIKKKKRERDEIANADDYDDVDYSDGDTEDSDDDFDSSESIYEEGSSYEEATIDTAPKDMTAGDRADDEGTMDLFGDSGFDLGDGYYNPEEPESIDSDNAEGTIGLAEDAPVDAENGLVPEIPAIEEVGIEDIKKEPDAPKLEAFPLKKYMQEEPSEPGIKTEAPAPIALPIKEAVPTTAYEESGKMNSNLITGALGEAFEHRLEVICGSSIPLTWSIIGGALPEGLDFNDSSGTIYGTPTAVTTETVAVKVSNPFGSAIKKLSICIGEPPKFAF